MLSFKIKRFCFYVIKVACLSYGEYIYKIPSTTNLTSIFGNHVHPSIEVDQVSMFLCQYLHRLSSVYLLLQPCDVVLTYSKTLGEKEHVDLSITEVVFNIK